MNAWTPCSTHTICQPMHCRMCVCEVKNAGRTALWRKLPVSCPVWRRFLVTLIRAQSSPQFTTEKPQPEAPAQGAWVYYWWGARCGEYILVIRDTFDVSSVRCPRCHALQLKNPGRGTPRTKFSFNDLPRLTKLVVRTFLGCGMHSAVESYL